MKTLSGLVIALAMSASAFSQTSAPAAPTLTAGAEFRGLRLDWNAVPGATWYQIEYRPHENGPFVQQGDAFPATTTSTQFSLAVHLFDWSWARYRLAACNDAGCTRSAAISVYNLRRDAVGYFKAGVSKAGAQFGSDVELTPDGYKLVVAAPGEVTSTASGPVGGAVYLFGKDADSKWSQRTRFALNARGRADGPAYVGVTVSISGSGNTIAISSSEPIPHGTQTWDGQVDVYHLKDNVWTRKRIPRPDVENFGGVQLSESGYVLAVGTDRSGGVAVYKSVNSVWQQVYQSPPNDESHYCRQSQLSHDGKALVRMCEDLEPSGFHTAVTRRFLRVLTGSNWSQSAELELYSKDSGLPSYDNTTFALDRTGHTIAVSYYRGPDVEGETVTAGFVRVFQRDGSGVYQQVAQVEGGSWTPESRRYTFGDYLQMSADAHTLMVGAANDSSEGSGPRTPPLVEGTEETGAVYVYRLTDSWRLVSVIKPNYVTSAQDNYFGYPFSVSQTGKTLAIGVPTEDSSASGIDGNWGNSNRTDSGAVFMY
jgi:hypothetical protein